MNDQSPVSFSREILIYLPTYNCAGVIVSVLNEIPKHFWDEADLLVIDNCSSDGTAEAVVEAVANGDVPANVQVVQPPSNVDYAGSQKLAYKLALQSPAVKWVIMLHGDGQYAPALLEEIKPHIGGKHGVVQGYRCKKTFPDTEETPGPTYAVIKILGEIESRLLGFPFYEWHSGFVMYATDFLRQVDLDRLTPTRHIDGHLLFAAEALGTSVLPVPIWKRYHDYPGFFGWERLGYVVSVVRLMALFRILKWMGRGRANVALVNRELSRAEYSVCSPAPAASE